jgi:hypothetical protein
VSYARRRLVRDGQPARMLIAELVDGFHALGDNLLDHTSPKLAGDFAEAYGVEPSTLWVEVQRQLQLRLRSIGLTGPPADRDCLVRTES